MWAARKPSPRPSPRGRGSSATISLFMETETIELHSPLAREAVQPSSTLREKVSAYVELTKPRITSLIVLTSAAGFCLGSPGAVDYLLLGHSMIGVSLLSSGFP